MIGGNNGELYSVKKGALVGGRSEKVSCGYASSVAVEHQSAGQSDGGT